MLKQVLYAEIRKRLHAMDGKQKEVAEAIGISAMDVSCMRRPGAENWGSTDKALAVLEKMGVDVAVSLNQVRPAPRVIAVRADTGE